MSEEIRVGALRIRFRLQGSESVGSVSIFEVDVPAGVSVPAAHSHDVYEETVYGLEGVLTFTADGKAIEVGPGEVLCLRRGVVHHFENAGDVDARALAIVTPGSLGPDYFRELGAILDEAASGGTAPDVDAIAAVMERHGLRLVR
jgi:quercetin dioxygenase-like cupin family protein